MDKIWNPQSWPRPVHKGVNLVGNWCTNLEHVKNYEKVIFSFPYASKFMEYLICVWQVNNIPLATLQLALSIASRFSQKNQKYSESTQLVLLVSLYIASKTIDRDNIPVSFIHKISNHSFTNKGTYQNI